jgi:hypothetical protein
MITMTMPTSDVILGEIIHWNVPTGYGAIESLIGIARHAFHRGQ